MTDLAADIVPSAQVDLVSNQVELSWLKMYPLSSKVIVDGGKEFQLEYKINRIQVQ